MKHNLILAYSYPNFYLFIFGPEKRQIRAGPEKRQIRAGPERVINQGRP
ncbi:MAG: hypothetical protein GYB55_09505 [Cytophagales bacterium]|nr:hypothetical protein [Cytophagales bacterium]